MLGALRLTLTDYLDPTRWRWLLSDERERFLADHSVHLDSTTREYIGFLDLQRYLAYHQPLETPVDQLNALGSWIGEMVFGGLRTVLLQQRANPVLVVQVLLPDAAQILLARPFELARFANGTSFRDAGIRFVYTGATDTPELAKDPISPTLRILAVFSLPARANPLNLRRERYQLQRLVTRLNRIRGVAIELRVVQYSATRAILQDALEEQAGWDVTLRTGSSHGGFLGNA